MIILTFMITISCIFLTILGYGIWSSIKEINRQERLKAEREARKYGNVKMTPVV